MTTIQIIFSLSGMAISVILGVLIISSWQEKHDRATRVSFLLWFAFTAIWFGGGWLIQPPDRFLLAVILFVTIFAILFFAPIGRRDSIRRKQSEEQAAKRVDERDVIFSRAEYASGSDKHHAYYTLRPELLATDNKLRALPELLGPGGRFYNPVDSGRVNALFRLTETLSHEVDGEIRETPVQKTPGEWTPIIKQLVLSLGAGEVGITKLNPAYIYSHTGRGPDPWGAEINNNHRYAVVFSLEMDQAAVETAPRLPITEESATQYLKGSQIAISLARLIRQQGHSARAHVAGSNYQIMLPPVAYDAGLGELGRMGYLISERFGPRMRLGAITTDLPLAIDAPVTFGVQDFCRRCKKCAVSCPSSSIPSDSVKEVRGVYKWQLDIGQCFHYWLVTGTDCGLCMRVCPYSHPPTFIHNLIRFAIKRSVFARMLAVLGDDLLYGRKIRD